MIAPLRYVRHGGRLLADVGGYSRFAWRLRGFLGRQWTLKDAQALISQRLEERETHFLRTLERICAHPHNPYRALLQLAGCELGDLHAMVRTHGIESTLRALRRSDVYISYEEFKGRRPIVRGGRRIPVPPGGFDNPLLRGDYNGASGGSTGSGTPVPISLDNLAATAPNLLLAYHAHGLRGVPTALWRGVLPDPTGVNLILRGLQIGQPTDRWFSPATNSPMRRHSGGSTATGVVVAAARLLGHPVPRPEPLSLDGAHRLARWAADAVRTRGRSLVHAPVSLGLRVSEAARAHSLDLTGAALLVGGEPLTSGKLERIAACGARVITGYAFTEAGLVGISCPESADPEPVHLFTDLVAVVQHPRPLETSEGEVDAFYFTSLLPTARKILLNVEVDDFGTHATRGCTCPLGALGYTQQLGRIRSFSKLTTEGETFLGSDLSRIVEDVLPSRFGGSPLDYQFLEAEDERGFTRLHLLVSRRIAIADESVLVEAVLGCLRDTGGRRLWRQAATLQVKRAEPIWTARGKLMPVVPLHLARRLSIPGSAANQ